jgi:BMFP domain-containing protein YqiC
MSKSAPLLDDLLTLGGSLFGNLVEARHELKAQAKERVETLARKLDLVSREEFDAAFAMLSKARALQDDLQERLKRIEAHLHLSSAPKKKKAVKSSLPSVKQGKNRKKSK